MHRMVFRGPYRGFVIWQEAGASGTFVRDPSQQWTRCDDERFNSIKQAEEYIDFVIEHWGLDRPAKPEASPRITGTHHSD